jgi:PAS domain S-box-containing protein
MAKKPTDEELDKRVKELEKELNNQKQNQEALKDAEERYRDLIESAHDLIQSVRSDGSFVFVNRAWLETLGYSEGELPTLNLFDIIHPDSLQHCQKVFSEIMAGQSVLEIEAILVAKSGKAVYVEGSVSPRLAEGKVLATHAILRDISEHRLAQKALRESEEKYGTILDSIEEIYFEVDIAGNFTFFNYSLSKSLGYSNDELMEMNNRDYMSPESAKKIYDLFNQIYRTGNPIKKVAYEIIRKDGSHGFHELSASLMKNQAGRPIGFHGIAHDITERKRAEDALQESEERYKALFERSLELAEEILKTGSQKEVAEYKLRRKDGEYVYVESMGAIIYRDGKPFAIQGIARDITERKQSEDQRLKLEAQLRQSQKMEAIGTLAGGIAHDFNNILSAMTGYTELALTEVEKGTRLEQNLQEVYKAGRRAVDLVKQILGFARQTDEEAKPVRISFIAKEALKLIRSSTPTFIEIHSNIESDSLVTADPTKIYQVFMNLCTNACYAMEEKGGVLQVDMRDVRLESDFTNKYLELVPGDYLKLTIADTGQGIPQDILDRVFEPFFTTKGPGEGTGMGLSLVHSIIKTFGGTVTVKSEVGKGSVFTVFLPVAKKEEEEMHVRADVLPFGTERVLFVDDEFPIAQMNSQALEKLGYRVTIRSSGIEALELFKAKSSDFDIVVTDMAMPNLTGDELATEMIRIRPDIPIVLCTGFSKRISEKKAAEIGIKAFAIKPLSTTELARTIRKILDDAKSSTQE